MALALINTFNRIYRHHLFGLFAYSYSFVSATRFVITNTTALDKHHVQIRYMICYLNATSILQHYTWLCKPLCRSLSCYMRLSTGSLIYTAHYHLVNVLARTRQGYGKSLSFNSRGSSLCEYVSSLPLWSGNAVRYVAGSCRLLLSPQLDIATSNHSGAVVILIQSVKGYISEHQYTALCGVSIIPALVEF